MTQDNASKLSFTIEESVWLNKGQEIAEVISMSLEPEITIEERNEYVQIKGGLKLYGEYRPISQGIDTDVEDSDPFSFRSIEEMDVNSQGIGEVRYFFPIDVTIPLNRISHLDDIFVQVESFDYDLPDKSCIQLTADITISGMSVQEQQTDRSKKVPIFKQDEETSFEYEATAEIPESSSVTDPIDDRKQVQQQDAEHHEETREEEQFDSSNVEQPSIFEEQQEQDETRVQMEQQQEQEEARFALEQQQERDETRVQMEQQQEQEEARKQDEQKQESIVAQQEEQSEVETESQEELQETNNLIRLEQSQEETKEEQVETNRQENVAQTNDVQQEDTKTSTEETKVTISPLKNIAERPKEQETVQEVKEAPKAKQRKNENALYLTKMLSNGEEKFSKLKMCIIQENESIDTIAERYNISTSQIIRMNRLESERLKEGQILYIPVGKK